MDYTSITEPLSPLHRKTCTGVFRYLPDLYIDRYGDLHVWFMGQYERGWKKHDGSWLFQMAAATFVIGTPDKEVFRSAYARARVLTLFHPYEYAKKVSAT